MKGCPILGTVPPGTIVVSELPSDTTGTVIDEAEPGWFALHDDPALSGKEITNPKQERDRTANRTSSSTSPTAVAKRSRK